jgi:hypothetical protein
LPGGTKDDGLMEKKVSLKLALAISKKSSIFSRIIDFKHEKNKSLKKKRFKSHYGDKNTAF